MLHLTKFLHGKGHVVIADSYFASFQTAVALLTVGLWFIGMLKTASAGFCKLYLHGRAWERGGEVKRGDTLHVETEVKVGGVMRKVYGHSWNEPGTEGVPKKVMISTSGDSLPAQFAIDEETGVSVPITRFVPNPKVVKQFFDAPCAIDVHNHLWQGVMAIEDHVGTQDHVFLLFCTIFGMCIAAGLRAKPLACAVLRVAGHAFSNTQLRCFSNK